jgi:restriction system protein
MNRKIIFVIGLLIYFVALFLPAWNCTSKQLIGWDVLAVGWMGLKIQEPRWFCNLIIFFAALAFGDSPKIHHKVTCFLFAALAATSVFGPYYCGPKEGAFYPDGESMGLGGYLWVLALWVVSISTLEKNDYLKFKRNSGNSI